MKLYRQFIVTGMALLMVCIVCAQAPCDTIVSSECKSVVADTAYNPYVTGVLGNWRANRSFTYYGSRAETNPAAQTDIRHNGTFADFTAFWSFQNNALRAQADTSRWVWNSEMTLFNRKGFEIENKDPLGRYNSGLYGYQLTLPVAVVQNSRYRESAFEGFEDYGFTTLTCDTGCTPARHIDFSTFQSLIDTTQKHSGKSSLRLSENYDAGLSFRIIAAAQDTIAATVDFKLSADACSPDGSVLAGIESSNKILLPVFSPIPGKKMVLSAWVKEGMNCSCSTYTHNRIVVILGGGTPVNFIFTPSGNVIEGWQRYESYFDIPADDTTLTVSLEATTDTVDVFFDDLRIHPFNANMKSFVFHPVNLRLMAELDENNYATFYEYDDDGTLIRLKKETQRGVKTIRETRSALVKEQ